MHFFLSFQRALSTKTKSCKRKLILWEHVFNSKKDTKNPSACQLANCQKQTRCKEDSRYQATPGNSLIQTNPVKSSKDSRRFVEPQPKPPQSYKLPRAVLLSRAMVEGLAEVAQNVQFLVKATFSDPKVTDISFKKNLFIFFRHYSMVLYH